MQEQSKPEQGPATQPSAPGTAPRGRGYMRARAAAATLVVLTATLAGLGGGAWWWAGTDQSLAQTITQVQRWLPQGQSLDSSDVTGSLRHGGQIGWLRWQGPSLSVEVHQARLQWSLNALMHGQLQLGVVDIQRLQLAPQAAAESQASAAITPPASLSLPLHVHMPFLVHEVQWAGDAAVSAHNLEGQYTFDGQHHRLSFQNLRWAEGLYSAQAQLQAHAPMALSAELEGQVTVPTPGAGQPLPVHAEARLRGELAQPSAQLELTAQVHVQTPAPTQTPMTERAAPSRQPTNPQASVQATLHPWQAQPLAQGSATLQSIDLSSLWPKAPHTQLGGRIDAGPAPAGPPPGAWTLRLDLHNRVPGPWDAQRLPLAQLQAQAHWDGQQWTIPQAQARVNESGSQGEASATVHYTPGTNALDAEVQLQRLVPQALLHTLAATPIEGKLKARTETASDHTVSVPFELDIHPAVLPRDPQPQPAKTATQPLAIQQVQARGRWITPATPSEPMRLELANAQIQALRLQARASNLLWAWSSAAASPLRPLHVQGQVSASMPGATWNLKGHMQPREGAGQLDTEVTDAHALHQWLMRLPGLPAHMPSPMRAASTQGRLAMQLQWQGGWEGQPWITPVGSAPNGKAPPLQLQAQLTVPRLDYAAPGSEALQLRDAQLQLSGSAAKTRMTTQGSANTPPGQLQWQTVIDTGWATPQQWQAQIQELRVGLRSAGTQAPWTATLAAPVRVQWQSNAAAQWQLSAGALQLAAPLPGQATMRWDATRLQSASNGLPRIQSKGELQALPLAWLDALPRQTTAELPLLQRMGISTDMLLRGQWNLESDPQWRARVSLGRAAGDLRLLDRAAPATAPGAQRTNAAGVEDAEVSLELNATDALAQLRWKSQRAGTVAARLSTRWTPEGDTPWPTDAPLNGTLHANLPDVGVWSAMAPPGWRVNGTLDAEATLSGNRQAPRWSGSLAAQDLAVRSALDGVDLQGGSLRAVLSGNELRVTELRLQGGRGGKARIPGLSGNRTPPPDDGGALTIKGWLRWADSPDATSRHALEMDLRAEAQALQVLARADRQASISGQAQATLSQGQLALSGLLKVDRATILLPEDSTPTLGQDVVVTSAALRQAAKQAQTGGASETGRPAIAPTLAVTLDLGPDFALQGHGITTRLKGTIVLRDAPSPGAAPLVTGELQTDQGRYRAWGQLLNVETGLIRFNGAYNNPSLDILALRPNITVRAGVQVTGSAMAPRVKLYSDPDLPDAEKLAWVVMGRDATAGGAEAAMLQQAALALLGSRGQDNSSRIAQRLGLDEIGFRGASSTTEANAAALTLGKRLSKDMYLSYERSLSGTMGTLYVFYDLSRRLTLRGQTGATSALDVIYTMRFD